MTKGWTEGKYQSFIKGVLRKGSTRWPPKYECLNNAKRGKMVNKLSGRVAEHFECAKCGSLFPSTLIVADHIEPVVPVTGFTTWDDVILRMFCGASGFQILCKECHSIKTKQENAERKLHKNNNKAEPND